MGMFVFWSDLLHATINEIGLCLALSPFLSCLIKGKPEYINLEYVMSD